MIYTITQNALICPNCKAGMGYIHRKCEVYIRCNDCKKTYKVLDHGRSDHELIVSDDILEIHDYEATGTLEGMKDEMKKWEDFHAG